MPNQTGIGLGQGAGRTPTPNPAFFLIALVSGAQVVFKERTCSDDPSAGSPTETLLRLLLPLNDQV